MIEIDDLRGYIESGNYSYCVAKRDNKSNIYDLLILIENVAYRVASFNTKNKRLIIPFTDIHIPTKDILEELIRISNNRERELQNESVESKK